MSKTAQTFWLLLAGLAVGLVHCGSSSERAELERLQRENEALRAQVEQGGAQPQTLTRLAALFANDPAQGTLAGLKPGDGLSVARSRLGPESRTRSWDSEGRPITQYEWDLEAGLTLRLNADAVGRVEKVSVVLANPQGVNIPTLAGLTLGRETYASVQQKFGSTLTTDLQLWGARGLYTVAQRTPLPAAGRQRLEFVYEMPKGLSRAELERIGDQVQRHNPAVLDTHLRDRAPFLVALEEVR